MLVRGRARRAPAPFRAAATNLLCRKNSIYCHTNIVLSSTYKTISEGETISYFTTCCAVNGTKSFYYTFFTQRFLNIVSYFDP